MLKYSIKKKSLFFEAMDSMRHRAPLQQQQMPSMPQIRSVATLPADKMASEFMSKHEFNKWFVDTIDGKFRIGELVTANHVPVKPGQPPFFWYEINYLEETYSTARYHDYVKEPIVVHTEVMPRSTPRTYRKFAPTTLRHLTKEELQLVYLQNTQPQGSA